MAVPKAEVSAWTRGLRVLSAFDFIIFLYYGMMWVATAGCGLTVVVGRRAFGVVEGSPMLSAASSLYLYFLTVGVMLCPVSMMLIGASGMRSVSNDSKKDIKEPLTPRQIARKMLKDPVMVGALIVMVFIMLIPAGDFVLDQSPPKGSQRTPVGSMLRDVCILGACATNCFVILPTTVLRQWRMK